LLHADRNEDVFFMSIQPVLPLSRRHDANRIPLQSRRELTVSSPLRPPAFGPADREDHSRHAELFYLQKQIQSRTPMVIVLEDGERIEGCIEWYDRDSLKIRGATKTLVYKSAIKYMYKLGDSEQ
jgi:sRNA-binding regulator protein Hfq